jgi:hypothetical protein
MEMNLTIKWFNLNLNLKLINQSLISLCKLKISGSNSNVVFLWAEPHYHRYGHIRKTESNQGGEHQRNAEKNEESQIDTARQASEETLREAPQAFDRPEEKKPGGNGNPSDQD